MAESIHSLPEKGALGELSPQLSLLADELRSELVAGDKVCVSFTQFAQAAYAEPTQAEAASLTLLDVFDGHLEVLAACVRVVDVMAELSLGCNLVALKISELWNTQRDEHKLARLADELLNTPERFQSQAASTFRLALVRQMALTRPDYAARLLEQANEGGDSALLEETRTWLQAGEFLRTQTEAVRFFWQRHMRSPQKGQDLKRMSARIALDAVRKAPVATPITDFFRASVPEHTWNELSAQIPIAPVQVHAQPLIPEQESAPPAPASISTRPSLQPRYSSDPDFGQMPRRTFSLGHPIMGLAATILLGASIAWFIRHDTKQHSTSVRATSPLDIKLPPVESARHPTAPKTPPLAPPAPITNVVNKTPQPPAPQAVVESPTSLLVTTSPSAQPASGDAPKIGWEQTITGTPELMFSSHIRKTTTRIPWRSADSMKLAASRSIPPAPRVSAADTRTPEAPVEVIAKPMQLTAYDRWVITQTYDLAQRYPELRDMQQAVVKGNWTSAIMKLEDKRHITEDSERYKAVLRWLVVDPPLGSETRRIIFEKWSDLTSPDECITLCEEMIQRGASHVEDITRAATHLLERHRADLSPRQQERLQRLGETTGSSQVEQ